MLLVAANFVFSYTYLYVPTLPIGKRQLIISINYFYGFPHILMKILSKFSHISHFLSILC